ncbi:MAG: hypothetical protein LCH37_15455, partial [Bacteroidetes bacterium]|nr:hypothetical protein [Bacteroidota bacterium]
PSIFSDEVFNQAFEKAELAKLGQAELEKYESSLKIYRDLKGVMDTAFDEGKLEGKLEGIEEALKTTARNAKQMGLSTEEIAKLTGLSSKEIEKL